MLHFLRACPPEVADLATAPLHLVDEVWQEHHIKSHASKCYNLAASSAALGVEILEASVSHFLVLDLAVSSQQVLTY